MTRYWTEETGFAEARRRVSACGEIRGDTLDLGGLQLVRLPEELRELTWLRRLYLGGNAKVREKPDPIQQDQEGCNALRELPDGLFPALAGLEVLDVAHNRLTTLPADIVALSALTSLNLMENDLGDDVAGP